jgi:O-antigen ligase
LLLLWVMLLFEPHWWFVYHGALWARHIPTALFALLALALLMRLNVRDLYLPLLLIVVFVFATAPFAANPAYVKEPAKALLLYYVFATGTLSFVRTPRQSVPILLLLGIYQFAWWSVLGAKGGGVLWHPSLANFDAFGPLMVIGTTCSLHFGLAARSGATRYVAFAVAAMCTLGLVSSFARGAVLSAAFVLAFMLYRSPNKRAAMGGVALAAAVVAFAGLFLFADVDRATHGKGSDTEPSFFAEMATVARDVNAGTGEDRRILWNAAWRVFLTHPLLGVGADNFGPFAARYFRVGDIAGRYGENPGTLYDRKLHSSYFQVLSEFGIVGSLLFVWLLVDFWKRNARLRTPAYRAAWDAATGGRHDLRWWALGLESGMLAFLATGVFYNQLFNPWLYVLLTANAVLYARLRAALGASALRRRAAFART